MSPDDPDALIPVAIRIDPLTPVGPPVGVELFTSPLDVTEPRPLVNDTTPPDDVDEAPPTMLTDAPTPAPEAPPVTATSPLTPALASPEEIETWPDAGPAADAPVFNEALPEDSASLVPVERSIGPLSPADPFAVVTLTDPLLVSAL